MPFPFMLIGAAAMAAMAAAQANQANQRAKGAAGINQQALNAEVEQNRLKNYDQMYRLGQESRSQIGAFMNGQGFGSGGSVNSAIAQMYADASMDSQHLRDAIKNGDTAASYQRQSIINQARSSMSPVGLAAIQGGLQGAALGASFGSAVNSYNTQSATSGVLNNPNAPAWQVDAVLKGVPAESLNNPRIAEILSQQYNTNQSLSNLAVQASQQNAAAASSALNYWNSRGGK